MTAPPVPGTLLPAAVDLGDDVGLPGVLDAMHRLAGKVMVTPTATPRSEGTP